MASVANSPLHILKPRNHTHYKLSSGIRTTLWSFSCTNAPFLTLQTSKHKSSTITCFATDKQTSPTEISSTARIRSEVLTPFRSVRMFFYLAFIASGGLGGLIATTQLIAALTNPSRALDATEIAKGLGKDLGAVSLFAFLYLRENKAKDAQIARLSREENLSNLKLRASEKKVILLSSLRGIARLVICAGPASFITESFNRSEPFTKGPVERGVLVVPLATHGNVPSFEFEESEEAKDITAKRKRLWQLTPINVTEWTKYISLRLDGRVRGSGVGYPPWNAFVAQLPPVKGMWSGLLDGVDGRV
ncbi:hypothetical protein TB2_035023 [Malus domestica]|uniref:Protein LOW PSII ACCUMULATION 1, chloroplastic n=1 Tax=Malus domestica TaxID=3750 RepID=A0A498JQC7_MALDO|nr:hypothetical protein DVH24_010474 [Malus domestica]